MTMTATRAAYAPRRQRASQARARTMKNAAIASAAAVVMALVLLVGSAVTVADGSMPAGEGTATNNNSAAGAPFGSALLSSIERQASGHPFP